MGEQKGITWRAVKSVLFSKIKAIFRDQDINNCIIGKFKPVTPYIM